MERRIDDQRPSAPLDWEAKHAAMERAGELPLERRVAERRAGPPALVTVMAETVARLEKKVLDAENLLHRAKSAIELSDAQRWSGLTLDISRALASQPAAPVQPEDERANLRVAYLGEGNGTLTSWTTVAPPVQPAKGSPAEAWKGLVDKAIDVLRRHIVPDGISDRAALDELYGIFDGPEYRAVADIEQDRCDARQQEAMAIDRSTANMMKIGKPAAPPVQRPGDVRDLHAEIMNLPCNPKAADLSSIADAALRAYQVGHRDARHAAAELVASVEHEALATTRPSAALDLPKLTNIVQNAYVGDTGEHLDAGPADAIARAILAASSGAVAVPGWISVDERLPEVGQMVLVYSPPTQYDHPGEVNISFDCIDPNDDDAASWLSHNEHYEHFCCVAKPEDSIGPSEKAPYTYWHAIPAAPATPAQGQTK